MLFSVAVVTLRPVTDLRCLFDVFFQNLQSAFERHVFPGDPCFLADCKLSSKAFRFGASGNHTVLLEEWIGFISTFSPALGIERIDRSDDIVAARSLRDGVGEAFGIWRKTAHRFSTFF